MESADQGLREVFGKEVLLLRDLLDCVRQERENLITMNTENLWTLMERKQGILESIEGVKREIKEMIGEEKPGDVSHRKGQKGIMAFSREASLLKEEIKGMTKENAAFIRETLSFFDEIISVFASGGIASYSYGVVHRSSNGISPLIYQREV